MKIPVFVSSPTKLNQEQQKVRAAMFQTLDLFGIEPRALGQSDYPTRLPLREVLAIARRCSGALILGFEQNFASSIEIRRGLAECEGGGKCDNVSYPTPWNNLESGILFALGLPHLVFKDPGISGGIFDNGVLDAFIHKMPTLDATGRLPQEIVDVFLKWQADVRQRYYFEDYPPHTHRN